MLTAFKPQPGTAIVFAKYWLDGRSRYLIWSRSFAFIAKDGESRVEQRRTTSPLMRGTGFFICPKEA
jgi:hypothetical protein